MKRLLTAIVPTLVALSATAANYEGVRIDKINVTTNAPFVGVKVVGGLSGMNPGDCEKTSQILFDGGTRAGINALAVLLAAKTTGSTVTLNIADRNCYYDFPQLISVMLD
ncbi:hypothetical protein OAS86_00710 [Gammaproteobacteria bacterium]|nr:hypothetical protein [Gammaproteobacteria bacterium]